MRLAPGLRSYDRRKQEVRLDALRSRIVKARAGFKCERCGGRGQLNDAHIVSRRFRSVRWDLDNAVCLCAGCHFWSHTHPGLWFDFARKVRGDGVFGILQSRQGRKVDRDMIALALKAAAQEYGVKP